MGGENSVNECILNDEIICLDNLDLIKLKQFYAAIPLVKTSLLSFEPEQFLSNSKKRNIRAVTDGMHPNEYHIILSPEQWSILEEMPTHLQIIGEAASGKTELLKAVLLKMLKYRFIKPNSRCLQSNISQIAEGLEQILFIILGNKRYLKDIIEEFIAQVKDSLHFPQDYKLNVEVHLISGHSA